MTSTACTRLKVKNVIDTQYRSLFAFEEFNDMQSIVLPQALRSDCNMVVAAPTGTGKTIVHELAILRSIVDPVDRKSSKTVYIAPNKALCQQKMQEWHKKFTPLNLVVLEVTGDTDLKQSLRLIAMASIIITTPEKWDSLTR